VRVYGEVSHGDESTANLWHLGPHYGELLWDLDKRTAPSRTRLPPKRAA
jgi:hypothetical protein